jgi:2-oxo-3-hexenedioate decarboxylase
MLAEELIELHRSPREVAPFSERYPGLSAASGYLAARALHEHRLGQGWKPVGRKIGFTNRTLWERYGVHEPMWGTVYDRTILFSTGDRCRVSLAGLIQPRIEPEICFKLRSSPRSDRLLDSIEWVAHSIEIVQCHHPAWKVTLSDCTADNGLHGRLVMGTPVAVEKIPDLIEKLPAVEARLLRSGKLVDRGTGANVLGSPLLSLGHLVELLARQPEAAPLAAGEIVTTGVLTDAHPVSPGETWSTEITGLPLPGLRITFT